MSSPTNPGSSSLELELFTAESMDGLHVDADTLRRAYASMAAYEAVSPDIGPDLYDIVARCVARVVTMSSEELQLVTEVVDRARSSNVALAALGSLAEIRSSSLNDYTESEQRRQEIERRRREEGPDEWSKYFPDTYPIDVLGRTGVDVKMELAGQLVRLFAMQHLGIAPADVYDNDGHLAEELRQPIDAAITAVRELAQEDLVRSHQLPASPSA